jgi:hypothetical protein
VAKTRCNEVPPLVLNLLSEKSVSSLVAGFLLKEYRLCHDGPKNTKSVEDQLCSWNSEWWTA